jgi:iron(III) transport system substrate-binding protein
VYDPSLQNNLYSSNFNRFEENTINRIILGPGLMVYLDQFKKQKFLEEWENAILQRE